MRTPEQQTTPLDSAGGPGRLPAAATAADDAGGPGRFFGYPDAALAGTWTVRDLRTFLRVSERKARELMRGDGAPPPLRLGSDRCDRWNPYQVIAWLHGSPEAAAPSPVRAVPDAAGTRGRPAAVAPGRQWSPRPADTDRRPAARR